MAIHVNVEDKLENMQLPAPELLSFYRDLGERTIWLDGNVDGNWLEYSKFILHFNREDKGIPPEERKPIRLLFFSYGGDLDVNNSLINTIELSQTPVWGYNMGAAASAGCYILAACHKRFSLRSAQYLLHKGSGQFGGTYDEVVSQVNNYTRQIEELTGFLMKHSRITPELIEENLGGEWYLTAEEAVELGLCDKIITDISELV